MSVGYRNTPFDGRRPCVGLRYNHRRSFWTIGRPSRRPLTLRLSVRRRRDRDPVVSFIAEPDVQTDRISSIALPAALFLTAMPLPGPASPVPSDASEIRLPEVTGPYGVGTLVWHWQQREASDDELLEVMAQLWYPTSVVGGDHARYRPLGGESFDRIRQSSIGAAPFASLPDEAPVVVVCPGRGTNRYYYTSIAEELSSQGFAVLAVDIPQIGDVEFPDGRIVEPSGQFRPSFELITGPYERSMPFSKLRCRSE